MKSQKLNGFLLGQGYKYERDSWRPETTVANYYRVSDANVPLCLSNDQTPQFWIEEHYFRMDTIDIHNITIRIRQEAPQGWIDFAFYNLSVDEFINKLDELEAKLLQTWETLFK